MLLVMSILFYPNVSLAQPQTANPIGTVKPIWKNLPVIGEWLSLGNFAIDMPDYLYKTDFPYYNSNSTKRIPFTEGVTVVRLLGGWHENTLGKGEASNYTDISQADLIYRKSDQMVKAGSKNVGASVGFCNKQGKCEGTIWWKTNKSKVQVTVTTTQSDGTKTKKFFVCSNSGRHSKDVSWFTIGNSYTFNFYEASGCSPSERGQKFNSVVVKPMAMKDRFGYRWPLLKKRMDPVMNSGVKNVTIVLDNVPYALTSNPVIGKYGQAAPPDSEVEWSNFIMRLVNNLIKFYGDDAVNKLRFRVGTENNSQERFAGTPEQYLAHYEATVAAIKKVAPRAKVGPFNQFGTQESTNTLTHTYLLKNLSDLSMVDFWPYSIYYLMKNSSNAGGAVSNARPDQRIPDFSALWSTLTKKPIEVQEHGVLQNEYGVKTPEPGVRGAALHMQTLSALMRSGVAGVWHWYNLFEKIPSSGGKSQLQVPSSLTWLYSVLEPTINTTAYNLPVTDSTYNKNKIEAIGFRGGGTKMIIVSAYSTDRSLPDDIPETVQVKVPKWFANDLNSQKIQMVELNKQNDLYSLIRDDFERSNILRSNFANLPYGPVGTIDAMGGSSGKQYVAQNWGHYETTFVDSLKLKNFSGTVGPSESDGFYTLTLSMKTPSIQVMVISN